MSSTQIDSLLSNMEVSDYKIVKYDIEGVLEAQRKEEISIQKGASCHHIDLSFQSDVKGIAQVVFKNKNNRQIFETNVEVIKGQNNLTFTDILIESNDHDTVITQLTLPNLQEHWAIFAIDCPKNNKSVQQHSKFEVTSAASSKWGADWRDLFFAPLGMRRAKCGTF